MSHIQVLEDGKVVYDNAAQVVTVVLTQPTPVAPPVDVAPTPAPPQPSPGRVLAGGATQVRSEPAQRPSTPSSGSPYSGYDLTPGNPKINTANAGAYDTYWFTLPDGRSTRVYYQQPGDADSGMHVTSYIVRNGVLVSPEETRVLANKQPFDVQGPGSFEFHVMPEKTGPLSVGLE